MLCCTYILRVACSSCFQILSQLKRVWLALESNAIIRPIENAFRWSKIDEQEFRVEILALQLSCKVRSSVLPELILKRKGAEQAAFFTQSLKFVNHIFSKTQEFPVSPGVSNLLLLILFIHTHNIWCIDCALTEVFWVFFSPSVHGSGVAKARVMAYFGEGTGPIHVDNVKCSGEERSLVDCIKQAPGTHNCRHSEDAGVICDYGETQPSYKEVKGQFVFLPPTK